MQNKLENIDLKIKWSDCWSGRKGEMCVNLKEFLAMRNITKFRKLLKIIRNSNTPDEEQKIVEWCEQFIELVEPFKRQAILRKYEKQKKIKFHESRVELLTYHRDRYRKNTPPYKELAEKVRTEKQNLSVAKAAYRQAFQDEKNADANTKFIMKCLETMG